jgi:delta 1-pyrroline-5-carboxylate dehydrogenase
MNPMENKTVLPVDTAPLKALRSHFDSAATWPYKARREALRALKRALKKYEEALLEAMHADMRKPRFEAYMADVGIVYAEINDALENLSEWMQRADMSTPISLWPASSSVHPQPLGVVLIISPWNYPVVLALSPLVGAIAAGNLRGGEARQRSSANSGSVGAGHQGSVPERSCACRARIWQRRGSTVDRRVQFRSHLLHWKHQA